VFFTMQERKGLIQFHGEALTVVGPDIAAGDKAPDFVGVDNNWDEIRPVKEKAGKVLVLASELSLETDVCDRETRRFNEAAAALGDDVHIFVISADLPFTQKRWCGASGVDQVTTVSDSVHMDFGMKYGAMVKEKRFLRRAVFVVNREGKVTYADYMPELGQEPDYDAVLAAVREAV
jgi:thiol peroxidase